MFTPSYQKFYNKIDLCWYFIRVGPKVRCTFCIGWGLNMSYLFLNLKIQKKFASHHIWILSLTVLSNLQMSICLKFLVLNTGVIPLPKQSWKNIIQGNLNLREVLRSLIILMNWIVGQHGEPKHILYSPCGSSLLTYWCIQQPWISSNKMITWRYIFHVSIFMYEG